MLLGVNIDHIAVLREARQVNDPDILMACFEASNAGADQITIHLREDRRHINENDVQDIIQHCKIPVNLECSINEEIIELACKLKPNRATLVPEKREELTTEGGLDLKLENLSQSIQKLKSNEIEVSLFIDPSKENIDLAQNLGVNIVELHTGKYANLFLMLNSNLSKTKYCVNSLKKPRIELKAMLEEEISKIKHVSAYANSKGIKVAAGHGLNYENVKNISNIKEIFELNIGQSIIAKSVFIGLKKAIKQMKRTIREKA